MEADYNERFLAFSGQIRVARSPGGISSRTNGDPKPIGGRECRAILPAFFE